MKNMSLTKLSAVVIIGAFMSSLVNANDDLNSNTKAVNKMVDEKSIFQPIDKDKNGLISEKELSASQQKLLQKDFAKIDVNADNGISEVELKNYLAKVKVEI